MNIKVYKTSEISEEDWKQIANGFNICFDTQHSVDHLMNYYVSTVFGYSYHAIAYTDDNKVMGYNSFIPTIYSVSRRETTRRGEWRYICSKRISK